MSDITPNYGFSIPAQSDDPWYVEVKATFFAIDGVLKDLQDLIYASRAYTAVATDAIRPNRLISHGSLVEWDMTLPPTYQKYTPKSQEFVFVDYFRRLLEPMGVVSECFGTYEGVLAKASGEMYDINLGPVIDATVGTLFGVKQGQLVLPGNDGRVVGFLPSLGMGEAGDFEVEDTATNYITNVNFVALDTVDNNTTSIVTVYGIDAGDAFVEESIGAGLTGAENTWVKCIGIRVHAAAAVGGVKSTSAGADFAAVGNGGGNANGRTDIYSPEEYPLVANHLWLKADMPLLYMAETDNMAATTAPGDIFILGEDIDGNSVFLKVPLHEYWKTQPSELSYRGLWKCPDGSMFSVLAIFIGALNYDWKRIVGGFTPEQTVVSMHLAGRYPAVFLGTGLEDVEPDNVGKIAIARDTASAGVTALFGE